jgi:hypothetical protein
MDAARGALGHGWPFAPCPRNETGERGPDEVGPNQEQKDLVTWSFQVTRRSRNRSDVRKNALDLDLETDHFFCASNA